MAKVTLEEKIKQLEEKQAKAKEQKAKADAAAKKATDDLKRVMKQAEAKEKEEAAKREQESALAFYRKYGMHKEEELDMWLGLIEESKMQEITISDQDGPVSRVVYDWLKSCYTKRLKANFTGGSQ